MVTLIAATRIPGAVPPWAEVRGYPARWIPDGEVGWPVGRPSTRKIIDGVVRVHAEAHFRPVARRG
jgi:hypothetical protein